MTKRLQHLLSWYLALSFAFAGVVAVSPLMHRLIEHGGAGISHTHFGGLIHNDDVPFHPAGHCGMTVENRPHDFFVQDYQFDLPVVGRLLSSFHQFLERNENPAAVPTDKGPNHKHHSLPQLIAGGLIDQAIDFPLFQNVPVTILFSRPAADAAPHLQELDRPTLSRGPPSSLI